ncbi:hypothetical protein GCM10022247_05210 [Allokutzneria multivorans]|uniref:Chromosome segregation ATPase n=1 Tax=Allokutzneria multivorans TaxID=1142134 RepID=A0ABP7QXK7_9PSEU
MYELSRVRLYSIGPDGARYENVTIDLSGGGEPVRHYQPMLGQADVLRPSPATILFLENGGGKSVLIKLIFSVMLPGKRHVVGTSNTKVLEKFVGAKEVAHVVLEWMHTETGRLLLTGKVSDWRGRSTASGENLVDLWYSLRPGQSVGLTTLPFSEDGQNLVATEFRARLDELAKADPSLELDWSEKQGRWLERLDQLGLDPETFRYQRDMNAGEGEAADLFTFASDEAFVNFLLRAVLVPADTRGLAELIAEQSEKLAGREEMELERDFVAEALSLLTDLADLWTAGEAKRVSARKASSEFERFVASLVQRVAQDDAASAELERAAAEAEEIARTAGERCAAEEERLVALKHRWAQLLVEEAVRAQEAAKKAVHAAEVDLLGWQAVDQLIEQQAAAKTLESLRKLLDEREDISRAAKSERDGWARKLARALQSAVDESTGLAAKADELARSKHELATGAENQWAKAIEAKATAEALAAQLHEQMTDVHKQVEDAVRAGLLAAGESAAKTVTPLEEQVSSTTSRLETEERRLVELDEELRSANAELDSAKDQHTATAARHKEALAAEQTAKDRAAELEREPRLVELLDTASVVLEMDAETLLDQLSVAQDDLEHKRTRLRIDDAVDETARIAWEYDENALLPPPPEVTEVVESLRANGIDCFAGWDYLAEQRDPVLRGELVRRLPHLTGGVLVNKATDLDQARTVLAERDRKPRNTIAVASTQSFKVAVDTRFDAALNDACFVVPPNEALFDADAALAERDRVIAEHEQRTSALVELDQCYHADRELVVRIKAWRAEHPKGMLAQLAEDTATAGEAARAAGQYVADTRMAVQVVAEAKNEVEQVLPRLRTAVAQLRERLVKVRVLAERESRLADWHSEREQALGRTAEEQGRAEALQASGQRLRQEAREHQRAADDHLALAARTREEIESLDGAAEMTSDDAIPAEPVPVLRETWRRAQAAYQRAEVGDDQLKELRVAEEKAASATKAFTCNSDEVREAAQRLLAGAESTDVASRAAAADRARRTHDAAELERRAADMRAGKREAELGLLRVPRLPLAESPSDVERAGALTAETQQTVADRRAEWESHVRAADALTRELANVQRATSEFTTIVRLVGKELEADGPASEPYEGDAESARERCSALKKQNEEAWRVVELAEGRQREGASVLVKCASNPRFDKLETSVRTHVLGVSLTELPALAADWASSLRPRLRSLTDDLEQIERHRTLIVERLRGLVDTAQGILRAAQRSSKLPEGLGDWTGEEFLRIAGTPVSAELTAHELGKVVDDAIDRFKDSKKVDGLAVVLAGVHTIVPRGFKVTMLKPDTVLRAERVRVSEVRDVFSGGQHLTAAIVLYCTLAALRSNNRGRTRHRHSGVLFLDNPIGRASASYLLDVQRGVAKALGVQLIYTTGLFDAEALAQFPLIIRLRNDADLRAGRKYLSVEQRLRPLLDALPASDGRGRITSARFLLKERSSANAD